MKTIYTLIGIALCALLLAGGPRVEGQGEQRVYLPVMVTPPQRVALATLQAPSNPWDRALARIVSVNTGGSDVRVLTNSDSFSDYHPAWSPRGGRIAFISTREITPQLYLMSPDGNGQTRLTGGLQGVERLRWSPDGSRIAFADLAGRLWLVNADGSGLLKLEEVRVPAFSWAPDGTSLAYSILGPQNPDTQIYGGLLKRVRLAGTVPAYTTLYTDTQQIRRVAWSPDSSQIAFGCAEGLCAVGPDGGGFTVIAPIKPEGLAWSPDSARIAASSDKLYLIDRDGGNQQELFTPIWNDVSPTNLQWSPDGSSVGLQLYKPPSTGDRSPLAEVWIIGLDGSKTLLGSAVGYSWSR
ncbi:MAG TPA: hypothetical protein VFS21_10240 [Roseiflexaceae bacterium]|nr:hypothetical protein [Roseiflexaceae bacterium]